MNFYGKFILILALLLSLLILVSCNTDTNSGSSEQTTDVTTEENVTNTPESIEIKLVDDKPNFKIVRSDLLESGDVEVESAVDIKNEIQALFGQSPAMGNDFLKAGSEYDDNAFEILVGMTKYPQSEAVGAKCKYGEYIIEAVGNKIVIMAYSDHCMRMATSRFVNILKKAYDKDTNTATLNVSDLNAHEAYDEQLNVLPIYDGGEFDTYYDAGNRTNAKNTQCDQIILRNTNEEQFAAYLSKLESAGFVKSAENTMNKCLFATYTNDKYMINAGFYGNDRSVRILIEPLTNAKNASPLVDRDHTVVTSSQITMIGLEFPDSSKSSGYTTNGLCMLIRLEDGRFIIVDGGFNRAAQANNLVSAIKEQSIGYTNTPTVAAWIVTHAHGDHEGVLISHGQAFKNAGIKVETMLANIMSESERQKAMNAGTFVENEGARGTQVLSAGESLGADIYKVHVGQVYHFANLELEIVYTLESIAPEYPSGLNTTSIVTRMKFVSSESGKETTYLSTGDATGWAMDALHKMFGSYLQSDILQICHHGAGTAGNDNGVANAYKTVNASLVLWPLGLHEYHVYVVKPYNKVVFEQSNYYECYFSGSQGDMTIVPIPYVAGETQVTVKCIGDCPVSHNHNENQ